MRIARKPSAPSRLLAAHSTDSTHRPLRQNPIVLGPYRHRSSRPSRLRGLFRLLRRMATGMLLVTALFLALFHFVYDPRLHQEVVVVSLTVHQQLAAEHAPYTLILQIAPTMQLAAVAIEDQRFYENHGVDPLGLLRAFGADLRAGHPTQGGATITEQLVKRTVFHSDDTPLRKLAALAWSFELADRYSKVQLLEMYLNSAYYGRGASGIRQAAWVYFRQRPRDLDVAHAAFLAALIQRPSVFGAHPFSASMQNRWRTVLHDMKNQEYITGDQEHAALHEHIWLAP